MPSSRSVDGDKRKDATGVESVIQSGYLMLAAHTQPQSFFSVTLHAYMNVQDRNCGAVIRPNWSG